MRVLVTGSRRWDVPKTVKTVLRYYKRLSDEKGEPFTVVHGNCPSGVDRIADIWARDNPGVVVERYRANWEELGRRAGPERNRQMVLAGADVCLAFIREGSPGASHCARLAERAGIPTARFNYGG